MNEHIKLAIKALGNHMGDNAARARMAFDGLSAEEMQHSGKHKHAKGKRIFKRMDKDGDGQVTRDESYTAWSAWFARIDTNGDLVVTTDEVNAHRQMKRAKHDK